MSLQSHEQDSKDWFLSFNNYIMLDFMIKVQARKVDAEMTAVIISFKES